MKKPNPLKRSLNMKNVKMNKNSDIDLAKLRKKGINILYPKPNYSQKKISNETDNKLRRFLKEKTS